MTCGIYKLNFTHTDKVYIGQSVNIEKRTKQHNHDLLANRCSQKMVDAFREYGLPTSYDILVECSIEELDTYEEEAIAIFDSVSKGFNTYESPYDTPQYTGYGFGNSKYKKECIVEVFSLLQYVDNSFQYIKEVTGVSTSMIAEIASGTSHVWLHSEYPDVWVRVKSLLGSRNKASAKIRGAKNSAKEQGITYPPIKSPFWRHILY